MVRSGCPKSLRAGKVSALWKGPTLQTTPMLQMACTLPLLHLLIPAVPTMLGAQTRSATEQVAVEVRATAPASRSEDLFEFGIHFEVAPGWHIYAPDPGDVGLPTYIEWRLPDGVWLQRLEWPVPERIRQPPFDVDAYTGRFIVRAAFDLGDDVPETATLSARIQWGACREVCIPQEAVLSIPARRRTSPQDGRSPVLRGTHRAAGTRSALCSSPAGRRTPDGMRAWSRSSARGSRTVWTDCGSCRPS